MEVDRCAQLFKTKQTNVSFIQSLDKEWLKTYFSFLIKDFSQQPNLTKVKTMLHEFNQELIFMKKSVDGLLLKSKQLTRKLAYSKVKLF